MKLAGAADSPWKRQLLWLRELADPVLSAGRRGKLRATMPLGGAPGHLEARRPFSAFEALCRLLSGMSALFEAAARAPADVTWVAEVEPLRQAALEALDQTFDPASADAIDLEAGPQILVELAFLAQALVRAPAGLWADIPLPLQARILEAMAGSRAIRPYHNNWLAFPAMVEVFLGQAGRRPDPMRLDYAVRQFDAWYVGDGSYGDGPAFRWDYYNSFVIQPMLLDITAVVERTYPEHRQRCLRRAQRHAEVLERLIGPDGSFPPLGRSIAYRCAAFHLLAQLAWRRALPDGLGTAQVRAALTAVIDRSLKAPGSVDAQGWLRIGLCGHQPSLGEDYISTGSLYLCSTAFLPLGLGPDDPYWQGPDRPWTQRRLWWLGDDLPADRHGD